MLDDHDPPTAGHAAMASGANGAATLAADRRCYVCENIGPDYHLLLVDDYGGLILVDQVIDFETAEWLCSLRGRGALL